MFWVDWGHGRVGSSKLGQEIGHSNQDWRVGCRTEQVIGFVGTMNWFRSPNSCGP